MDIIQFPPARVLEINHYILGASPGHQGPASIALLEGGAWPHRQRHRLQRAK